MIKLSLKSQNIFPLASLVLLALATAHVATIGQVNLLQFSKMAPATGLAAFVGVICVWFTYLIPADAKHMLVFLRFRDILPGRRFLELSTKDSRIDSDLLREKVAGYDDLAINSAKQNQYWYKNIYRPLIDLPEISSAHKSFLLYRDTATVIFLCLCAFGFGGIWFSNIAKSIGEDGLYILGAFLVLSLLAANIAGKRFVTTSVAIFLSKEK